MSVTLTLRTPDTIDSADFIDGAARGFGWRPEQGITAEEAILDQLEAALYDRYASHIRQEAERDLGDALDRESRGQAVQRESEERERPEAAGGRPE